MVKILPQELKKRSTQQVPEIAYSEGEFSIPFALAIPQHKISKPMPLTLQQQITPVSNNSSSGGWALLGLTALVLITTGKLK